MKRFLQVLFFALLVRPLLAIVLGTNMRHGERLPKNGPAILIANHNSHLDTLLLMNLYPLSQLHCLRPVAAADYFMRNKLLAWFALNIMNIIPLERRPKACSDPLAGSEAALNNGEILILFPEGSRGEPEKLSSFKSGIAHLMKRRPDVAVTPIYLHGLGKALPKGDWMPVPFFADVFIGHKLVWQENREATMQLLEQEFHAIRQEGKFAEWE